MGTKFTRTKFWTNQSEAILVITFLLIIIGSVNIFSASFVRATVDYGNQYFFLVRHLVFVAVGTLIMLVVSRIPYRKWRQASMLFMLFTLLCLIAVALFGVQVNGARRWLNIGIQFQPSEVAKLAVILFTGSYLGDFINRQRRVTIVNRAMGFVMIIAAIVCAQPDMGTAAIIFALAFNMHILAGMATGECIKWIVIAVVGLAGIAVLEPYRLARLAVWYDPWSDVADKGYQTVQSIIAIGSGGAFGEGLGMGISKFSYLPEPHTDFAFAVLCQEMGSIGVLIVCSLLIAFCVYGSQIALACRDGMGRMLAIGIVMLISGQSVSNMAMVCGLLPVIGVPLPFISYGGTSLLVNMIAVGVLVNIARYNERERVKNTPPDGGEELPQIQRRTRLRLIKKGA